MELRDFPDWHHVVATHWEKTTGYLLSFREPCIAIRDEELQAIRDNRVLVGLDADALRDWQPQASWLLAVLLCPDDNVEPLVEWILRHDADPERIHFYAHPEAHAFDALLPWKAAGLPNPKVDEDIDSWKRLHKRFGNDLAIQILKDWS